MVQRSKPPGGECPPEIFTCPGTPHPQIFLIIPSIKELHSCAYERIKGAMPSKSVKQRKFMAAAANNPKFAKRADIPQGVARDFVQEDQKRRQRLVASELRK
jgi:hypothetical protein